MSAFYPYAALLGLGLSFVDAVPLANSTNTPSGWIAEPKSRGTFGILLTSVATLGLCVWTALHIPIIPAPHRRRRYGLKIWWMVKGLFAPEYLLTQAFAEWRSAKLLAEDLKKLSVGGENTLESNSHPEADNHLEVNNQSQQPDGEDTLDISVSTGVESPPYEGRPAKITPSEKNMFDTSISPLVERPPYAGNPPKISPPEIQDAAQEGMGRHLAFFIGMGGFTLRPPGDTSNFPATVSAQGFWELSRQLHIPAKTRRLKSDIVDKGKTDSLGKTIVLAQAAYMAIQCIARKAAGLPVTLLELHVVMHVLCTVGTYGFWWLKPLDVGQPILVIDDEDQRNLVRITYGEPRYDNLLVSLYQPSKEPGRGPDPEILHDDGDIKNVHFFTRESSRIAILSNDMQKSSESYFSRVSGVAKRKELDRIAGLSTDKQVRTGGLFVIDNTLAVTYDINQWRPQLFSTLNESDLKVLRSAAKAVSVHTNKACVTDLGNPYRDRDYITTWPAFRRRGIDSVGEWASSDLFYLLLPPVYGACHAAAWHFIFPTILERELWRISSLIIVGLTAPSTLLALMIFNQDADRIWYEAIKVYLKRKLGETAYRCLVEAPVTILLGILFVARAYLMIESFSSLRDLPEGSYRTTPWERYLPHI